LQHDDRSHPVRSDLHGAITALWRMARETARRGFQTDVADAAVILINLAIWTVPDKNGNSLVNQRAVEAK